MDFFSVSLSLLFLIGGIWANTGQDACFTFNGDGFLKFTPLNFDNNNDAHYSLSFSTTAPNGILMYSAGPHDFEVLFIENGHLIYRLFNPSATGVEGTFGGNFVGDELVNTGHIVEVDTYRKFIATSSRHRNTLPQTGMVYKIRGREHEHLDYRSRSGFTFDSDVYIGGYSHNLSASAGNFTGQIRSIREEKNNRNFTTFSHNRGGRVIPSCLPNFNPV